SAEDNSNIQQLISSFSCAICGLRFSLSSQSKCRYFRHVQRHGLQMDSTFVARSETSEPQQPDIRSSKQRFHCTHCDQSFTNKHLLYTHSFTHSEVRLFKCDHCRADFKVLSALCRHRKIHSADKPFQCGYCNKRFHRRDHYRLHEMVHTRTRPFGCQLCEHRFKSRADQRRHQLKAHA
ncbi:hypothetical protein BOX15_Mlig023337g1, partial [Macrostomum lignano]